MSRDYSLGSVDWLDLFTGVVPLTRKTALIIHEDPQVYAAAYGPIEGRFGLYIGTIDETRSRWERHQDLLISGLIFDSAEAAKSEADQIITGLRAQTLECLYAAYIPQEGANI